MTKEEEENWIKYGNTWKPGEEPEVPEWKWRLIKLWLIILALVMITSCVRAWP